ncbi:MAG: isoprenylcysteine carboxylmethyltransferase family protein [Bacteroidetes bacterium]|nr:isoprenylcysteine carboxylmethyltransferase family protein [Bacteroidota bacterium]
MQNIIVLTAFGLMVIVLFLQGISLKHLKIGIFGKPPIQKFWFVISKFSLFGTIILCNLKAIHKEPFQTNTPDYLIWSGITLIVIGCAIEIISFINLGMALKFGLPEEKTTLKTKGLYSLSRNPIYLGFFVVCIGSLCYYPNIVNLILIVTTVYLHYKITLAEEKFLEKTFGKEWEIYKNKVRRYI